MGRLILVRHGESTWNRQNRFTGWVDVSLSQQGIVEAGKAGRLLAKEHFDIAFTSALIRAQHTLYEILRQNRQAEEYFRIHENSSSWYGHFTPVEKDKKLLKIHISEQLNERYYGDLQGMDKDRARKQFGPDQVHLWRRSYDIPPPGGESLKMTAARTLPYFNGYILPHLGKGKHVLVAAHGNSLRSIIMHIKEMTPQQILEYELGTGTVHVFDFNRLMKISKCFIMRK